jgi:hypothetical protein
MLSPKGLFGGLTKELDLGEAALAAEIGKRTSLPVRELADLADWRRGGAETYIGLSEMRLHDGSSVKVVGKAFVAWGPTPSEQQARWEIRRTELSKRGVQVPKVYCQFPAMTVEEYIEGDMPPLAAVDPPMAFQLGQIVGALQDFGLRPLSLHSDLRVANGRVYYIDFGSDLLEQPIEEKWVNDFASSLPPACRESFSLGLEAFGRSH